MDEKREPGAQSHDESPKSTEQTSQPPQAGSKPTGQNPEGTGGQSEKGGSTYQPGQGGKGGSGYQPDQSQKAGGLSSGPGQAAAKGGEGDRTNLSGMGGPEKSNWNKDSDKATEGSES